MMPRWIGGIRSWCYLAASIIRVAIEKSSFLSHYVHVALVICSGVLITRQLMCGMYQLGKFLRACVDSIIPILKAILVNWVFCELSARLSVSNWERPNFRELLAPVVNSECPRLQKQCGRGERGPMQLRSLVKGRIGLLQIPGKASRRVTRTRSELEMLTKISHLTLSPKPILHCGKGYA